MGILCAFAPGGCRPGGNAYEVTGFGAGKRGSDYQVKIALKYGLISGVGVSAYVMLEYLLGFHTSRPEVGKYSGFLAAIIPIIAVYLAVSRRHALSGLTFGRGLLTGVAVTLISAVVLTVFFLCYNRFINPGWQEHLLEWQKNRWLQEGQTPAEVAVEIERQRQATTGAAPYIGMFLFSPILGAVAGLISTAVVRRRRS
jgi:Na+/H+-dicarboxylate symporter